MQEDSVVIENVFTDLSPEAYSKYQLVTATALSTPGGATSFLSQAGLTGYSVTSVTVMVTQEDTAYPPPSSPPETVEVGLIVGCAVAGVLVCVLAIAAFFFLRKKKQAVAPS